MNWSQYMYLAWVCLAGLILLALLVRLLPSLSAEGEERRRTAPEVALLLAAMVLGILAIYWNFLLGDARFGYWDLGSDTLEQYVPFYLELVRGVGSGSWGPWNFDYGLGASLLAFATWANDPFNLVTVPLTLVLGTSRLGIVLALVQALKVILSGLLFDHLLTFYCRAPLSRVFGSLLYAFGGWLILWGQHYWLGTVYVDAVLLALLVELLMERWTTPRFAGLMVATAATVLMSVYSGYMVLLFAAAYAIIRSIHVSEAQSPLQWLRFFLKLAAPVVCGLLVSCALVLPYGALITGETSRVTAAGGMSLSQRVVKYLTGFVPLRWLPLIMSRILGNSLVTTGDVFSQQAIPYDASQGYLMNSYEFIMAGVGGGAVLLVSQCLSHVRRECGTRDRVLVALTATLTVLFCVNNFLPALSSVFDLKFRGSFVLMFPMVIAASVGWEQVVTHHELGRPSLVAACAVVFASLAWSLLNTQNGRLVCVFFLLATTVGLVCLLLGRAGEGLGSRVAVAIACAAFVSMSVVDGFFATNLRTFATTETFPAASHKDDDTLQALAWIRQGDDGFYRIDKTYRDWTAYNDALVQGYHSASAYNSTTDSDVVTFYRQVWPAAATGGSAAHRSFINDPDEPVPATLVGIRYVLSKEPLSYSWLRLVHQSGSVYVYQNVQATSLLTLHGSTTDRETADALASTKERQALLSTSMLAENTEGVDLSEQGDDPEYSSDIRQVGTQTLSGTVKTSGAAYACLPVPYTAKWVVTVDGKEVPTFKADYGFVGFKLSAGSHTVTATYQLPLLPQGIACSCAGIVLGAFLCARGQRKVGAHMR